ncbi:MAG: efflux transporter outer membrane subunit [Actinomycetota bacterium]
MSTARILALVVVASLGACSLAPDYQRPEAPVPATWSGQASRLPQPAVRWWTAFGSARLDALVDEALSANQDLAAAVARIRIAQGQSDAAFAALLPTLQGTAGVTATAPTGERTPDVDGRSERVFQAGGRASWELDLWGRNRSADEAALAALNASRLDREALAVTLAADVATGYLRMLQACDRLAVAERNVAVQQDVLAKMKVRRTVGEGTELEVAQQTTVVAVAEAAVPPFTVALAQARHQLGALIGRPLSDTEQACASLDTLSLPEPAVSGLPSEVLLNRPDIRKAEELLRAANANIGTARAKLFPALALSAEGGWNGLAASSVGGPLSVFWALGGNVVQTIFDGGRTFAEIDAGQARKEELVASYRQAILNGLRDAEDALSAISAGNRQLAAQDRAVESARTAQGLAQKSFDRGMSPYITVIDAHRTRYQTEDALVAARFSRATASVQLFRAVAGPMGATP